MRRAPSVPIPAWSSPHPPAHPCALTTAVGVRSAIGHADYSSHVVLEAVVEFVVEVFPVDRLTALPGAGRIAALQHELRDVAMKEGAIVVAARGKGEKVRARLRCLLAEELRLDVAE